MNRGKNFSGTGFFVFVCLVMILYSSYRYPFQINSSVTSPTYTDTPLALQLGKYLMLFIFTLIIVPFRCGCVNIKNLVIALLFTCPVVLLGAIKWIIYGQAEFLQFPLSYCLFYLFVVFLPRIYLGSISLLIKNLFFLGVIVDVIQLVLFFIYDRLPALAYKNSFSVRFGSFLDDPNGYGILCCLFIGWVFVYYKESKGKHMLFQLMNVFMVLLTQSVTALACMLVIVGFLYYRYVFFWVLVLLFLSVLLINLDILSSYLNIFLEMKKGSVDSHLTIKATHETFYHIVFGGDYNQQESWWLSLYVNYGLAFAVFWGGLNLAATIIFLKTKKERMSFSLDAESTYSGLCCLIFAFWIGMLNLPLPLVFPLNFVFFVVLFLTVQKKIVW